MPTTYAALDAEARAELAALGFDAPAMPDVPAGCLMDQRTGELVDFPMDLDEVHDRDLDKWLGHLAAWIELELAPVQPTKAHQSGSGQIAGAATSATVAVGAAFDGLPVAVLLKGAADGTLTHATRYEWDGAGNLTVHGNAAATAAVDFTYIVFTG